MERRADEPAAFLSNRPLSAISFRMDKPTKQIEWLVWGGFALIFLGIIFVGGLTIWLFYGASF